MKRNEEIKELRKQDLTYEEIGNRYGIRNKDIACGKYESEVEE